jgi:hypothetical protein
MRKRNGCRNRVTLNASPDAPGQNSMPRKKKAKRFRAVTAVKELARERVGSPPAAKIVLEKKKKPERHKQTLHRLLDEAE